MVSGLLIATDSLTPNQCNFAQVSNSLVQLNTEQRRIVLNTRGFKPKGLATAIGSMPQTDPVEACSVVLRYLTDIPAWPQLPERSFAENMYVQYSEGLPGVVVEDERIYIDRTRDLALEMEELYAAYIENDLDRYAISRDYAPGFYEFLSGPVSSVTAVKGQVTGPISFGLTVTDQDRRPSLYDETLADAIARLLRMKAAWMERELNKLAENTIVFLDEPYLASLGSAYVALDNETVIKLTNEALGGLTGLTGMHCCGNTDWSVLMATDIDILNFDACTHGKSVSLYPDALKRFLDRGGILAWGIIPNKEEDLNDQSVDKTIDRLNTLFELLVRKGISMNALVEQCLITPACSLAGMSADKAEAALQLTVNVSKEFRRIYRLDGN